MIRSMQQIGDLWPPCSRCRHIAQAHDNHILDVGSGCDETVKGQCPTCGTHAISTKCSCKGYHGPTMTQFAKDYLTPEEYKHYDWEKLIGPQEVRNG